MRNYLGAMLVTQIQLATLSRADSAQAPTSAVLPVR